MASSDEGSDGEVDILAQFASKMSFPAMLPDGSSLKPKMDQIFTEVEQRLPSIDFDFSDVSSDEDVGIFQRSLISTTSSFFDSEKDLDESLTSDQFEELLSSSLQGSHSERSNSPPTQRETVSNGMNLDNDYTSSSVQNEVTEMPSTQANTASNGILLGNAFRAMEVELSRVNREARSRSSGGNGMLENSLFTMAREININHVSNEMDFSVQQEGTLHINGHNEERVPSSGRQQGRDRLQESGYLSDSVSSWRQILRNDSAENDAAPKPRYQGWVGKSDSSSSVQNKDSDMQNGGAIGKVSMGSSTSSRKVDRSTSEPGLDPEDEHSRRSPRRSKQAVKKKMASPRAESREVVARFIPERTRLSLHQLENIDLDNVLSSENAKELNLPSLQPQEAMGDTGEDTGSEPTLIQRLLQLSVQQSGQSFPQQEVDPVTGAVIKKKKRKGKKAESKEMKTAINESIGGVTADLEAASQKSKKKRQNPPELSSYVLDSIPKKEEPETVYLDLRNFEQQRQEEQQRVASVQRILRIHDSKKKEDSSDSEDEGSAESWFEQRRKIRAAIERGSVSQVLPSKPSLPKAPKEATHAQRLAHVEPKRPLSGETQGDSEVKAMEQKPEPDKEAEEREKQRRMDTAKKLREQREHERQSRLRLAKQLEALRPKTSVSGRYPCAEETPVVFDVEASYEPMPQCLPDTLPADLETILLTVHLSTNGEIIVHRGGNKSVDMGLGLSASCTTLLTWLLSLVPHDFTFLDDSSIRQPAPSPPVPLDPGPFCVLGLQQLWFEEQLCIIVAIAPKDKQSQVTQLTGPVKSKKAKLKDAVKSCTPFQQQVTKFLSTNTLHSVCPWLQDFTSVEISSPPSPSTDHPTSQKFAYKPPLPNITTKPLSTFMQMRTDPDAVKKVFGTPVGFFYQSVESDECQADVGINDDGVNYETQNTMSLVYKKIYQNPVALMGILSRVLQEGLDISGIRLLYPSVQLLSLESPRISFNENAPPQSNTEFLNSVGPILAIALRGTFARSIWLDAVGPSDPALARRTDPNSLCALYGGESREECLLFCPRNPARIQTELARWFGGRVPPSGVIDVGAMPNRKERHCSGSPKGGKGKRVSFHTESSHQPEAVFPSRRPPATLTATVTSDIFLTVSPLLPVKCLGVVMATCQRRGYQLRGVRRMRLNTKRASSLGVSGKALSIFSAEGPRSPQSPVSFDDVFLEQRSSSPQDAGEPSMPCTVLLLQKENALHSAPSLIEAFMVQLCLKGVLGSVQSSTPHPLTSSLLFQYTGYTDSLLHLLGGDFSRVPDIEITCPSYIAPELYTNPEIEQIVVLTLTGHLHMRTFGLFLAKLLNMTPYSKLPTAPLTQEGFELLGIKWLPSLSINQAKELTPYEVGDKQWKKSIHTLTSEPAVVLLLRGINAFKRVSSIISSKTQQTTATGGQQLSLEKLMSPTPEIAYRQMTLFFRDLELFPDPHARPLLHFMPPVRQSDESQTRRRRQLKPDWAANFIEESVFRTMLAGPRLLTSVLIFKPDAVRKHLSKVFRKVTHERFTVVGLKMKVLITEEAWGMVPQYEDNDIVRQMHVDHMTSGPSFILCVQRENAVKKLLDVIGAEDPQQARRQSIFNWRGTFGVDPVCNGIYASADYQHAMHDVKQFFPEGLCCSETPDLKADEVSCPGVNVGVGIKLDKTREVTFRDPNSAVGELYEVEDAGSKKNTGTTPAVQVSHITMLTQTNCVVLTPAVMKTEKRSSVPAYVYIVEEMLKHGFEVCGAQLIWFTQDQAQQYLHLCDAGSYKLVPMLTSGPSLVLAVQRDNAVMAFDVLLGGPYTSESIYKKYGEFIMRPKDTSQVSKHLAFFFDHLMPGCHAIIREV
ncbi:uncharacterized protein LOC106181165 isoform X1 [Lingula anatina]|uniref:Uncharacterized protein LOC106181165 isoform X1 n=1 Tax=Lingula anatina TaxID=7574 RepID=A0A1S3KE70_LINAN|nr:uncharacterized protein LOC106181165 isoform X1 [Lingula anatina]|eukprot:XP_013420923.1 uncharacterized protein LOC106181165 isoform X1 [Lingula anatina]